VYKVLSENLRRDPLGDGGGEGRIILKWILRNQNVKDSAAWS
jgi:hypothetical protein